MRKFLLSIAALLIAGAASAQPIGVRVTKDTTNSRLLVRADNGEWLGVWGSGTPSFTTFLGENVPAGAIYFNTATGTPYRFSSGSWAASSGGSAAAVTPATTTVGSSTSCFLVADSSSVLQCASPFLANATGAGNGVFTVAKSPSGASQTSNFLNITGTQTPVSASTWGAYFKLTGGGSAAFESAAMNVEYLAGYTGGASNYGLRVAQFSAGTGTTATNYDSTTNGPNGGLLVRTVGTTAGSNVGATLQASGGNENVGLVADATTTKASSFNWGAIIRGRDTTGTGATGAYIGNDAGLTDPTAVNSTLQLNNSDQAYPILVAQDNGTTVVQIRDGGSIGGKDAVNGTDSDTAGGNLVIGSGLGTGTGAGGDLKLQRSPSIATGTAIQTASDAYYIRSQMKALSAGSATPFARINLASGVAGITGWTGGTVFYTLVANDAAEYQSRSGTINFTLVNKGGTETCAVGTVTNEPVANSSGTTTLTFDTDTTGPTNGCDLRATGASSLSETTLALFYSVVLNGPGTVTPQ